MIELYASRKASYIWPCIMHDIQEIIIIIYFVYFGNSLVIHKNSSHSYIYVVTKSEIKVFLSFPLDQKVIYFGLVMWCCFKPTVANVYATERSKAKTLRVFVFVNCSWCQFIICLWLCSLCVRRLCFLTEAISDICFHTSFWYNIDYAYWFLSHITFLLVHYSLPLSS